MNTQCPIASVSVLLLFSMTWISWIGCDKPADTYAEPDYQKRTISVHKVLIDKPCTLGSSPAMVSPGWIPVHLIFSGDEEIIEGMTAPFIRVQILDPQGNAIATHTPEFVYQYDSSIFLVACVFQIQPEHNGHIGRVELFGNEQLLLIRKLFRVR